ncbi:hypothetical protein Zmor_021386 [Zophobas morio]|uniref:Mos1 transposase HTH domain-containing protein n=1 Tax=Zophobas morio TaxID=2755281 RepID=A0AA38MAZ2_9CUCU|nr:hypothetical protein Zmor_021386 [Zophobas morio]
MSEVMKIEYRAVIKLLTREGISSQNIKDRLDEVYGQKSPTYSVMKEWSKRFRMGQKSLEDDARTGRPVEMLTDNNIALVEDLVLGDRCLKVKEIAQQSGLSDTTALRIVHDHDIWISIDETTDSVGRY